jgi:cytoskeleton protein RodZ
MVQEPSQPEAAATQVGSPVQLSAVQIGQILRVARERMGLSLEDVAHEIRVRVSYLVAMEQGETDRLPGMTFAVGFLRIYARFLLLPEDVLVQSLQSVWNGREETLSNCYFSAPDRSSRSHPGRWLVAGSSALFIAFIAGYERFGDEWRRWGGWEHTDTRTAPVDRQTGLALRSFSMADAPLPQGPVARVQVAVAGADPEGTTVMVHESASPETPPATEPASMVLEATGPVWIEVRDPQGRMTYRGTLKTGERYTVPTQGGPYSAAVGNAASVRIRFGTRTLSTLGKAGEVVRHIPLTPEWLAQRM